MAADKKPKKLGKGLWTVYKVEGGKVSRENKFCPKCGDGFFLAKHDSRLVCGKCKYVEMQSEKKVEKPKK